METLLLCLQTPSPKLRVTEVVNLVSPDAVIQQSSLCLQTPSPKLHVTEVIDLVSPVDVIQQSSTINLVTPPPKSKSCLKVEPKHDTSKSKSIKLSMTWNVPTEQKSINHLAPAHACESGWFPSLDAAIIAVCDEEESLGHKWVKGQTKKTGGEVRCAAIITDSQLSNTQLLSIQPIIAEEDQTRQTAGLM